MLVSLRRDIVVRSNMLRSWPIYGPATIKVACLYFSRVSTMSAHLCFAFQTFRTFKTISAACFTSLTTFALRFCTWCRRVGIFNHDSSCNGALDDHVCFGVSGRILLAVQSGPANRFKLSRRTKFLFVHPSYIIKISILQSRRRPTTRNLP